MAQRVEIAIAIAMQTRIMLIDEGTSGIDKQNKDNVLSMVRNKVNVDKLTAVSVSHDVSEVSRFADRVLYIDEGCLKILSWDREKEERHSHRGGVSGSLVAAMSGRAE